MGEKHQRVVASYAPPTWNLVCNPSMCPHWELNQQLFDSQADAQPLSHTSQGYILLFLVQVTSSFSPHTSIIVIV